MAIWGEDFSLPQIIKFYMPQSHCSQQDFLKFFFFSAPDPLLPKESHNCFCTSQYSPSQAQPLGRLLYPAAPFFLGLGMGKAAGESPTASVRLLLKEVTTVETEVGAVVRPPTDLTRAGNRLRHLSFGDFCCPTDD